MDQVETVAGEVALSSASELGGDLLWGRKGIGGFLGISENRTRYLIATKQIPVGKMRGQTFSRRSWLRERFATPA